MRKLIFAVAALAGASAVFPQGVFQRGDVLVTTAVGSAPDGLVSKILIYRNDGTFKQELASSVQPFDYRETLEREGIVYAAAQFEIQRFDETGLRLAPFNIFGRMTYFSPALDGSLISSNGSGELYRFNPDGSLRVKRETVILNDPLARGVEMSPDQCTVIYATATRLARWDSCQNSEPELFGSPGAGTVGQSLRMLPNGHFLAAFFSDMVQYDRDGNIVRRYGIPGDALALDLDGTSFWASAGGTLLKVDIATGTILKSVSVGAGIDFLSVVGEPRAGLRTTAEIPAVSTVGLMIMALALAAVASSALRA